jgi:hypothetical protein
MRLCTGLDFIFFIQRISASSEYFILIIDMFLAQVITESILCLAFSFFFVCFYHNFVCVYLHLRVRFHDNICVFILIHCTFLY